MPGKAWISEGTWKLIATRASLLRSGKIRQAAARRMKQVVTVLIPKRGGDYRGIGLLEPIWKVLERVMDLRLETIKLHDSLHGCLAGRGTGTGIIEAKLA